VSTTVEPDTATLLTERDTPPTNTAKSEPAAVVADNASEYVNVIVVPAAFVAADTNEGTVLSTVELFVTEVAASVAASLPAASCTAVESLLTLGSVYATVTSWPDSIEHAASVNTTVEPERMALVSEHDTPPTLTANAPVGAIVPPKVSEYVNVTVVPALLTAAETNVGAV
jgi:hypothetical protein